MFIKINKMCVYVYYYKRYRMIERKLIMNIHVVSAEFEGGHWYAVKAFKCEQEADDYAMEIYENGCYRDKRIFDSRVDEVNLI